MREGAKRLITGISIIVIGGALLPFLWVLPLFLDATNTEQFIVPGTHTFEIETPSRYYLWNDYQTFFEGTQYSKSEVLPDGLEISVKNSQGDTLFFQTDTNITFTSGKTSRSSIAHLEFDHPETITLSVGGDFETRVFSFGQAFIGKFFSRIFNALATAAVLSTAGTSLAVWGIVKLLRKPTTGEAD